MNKILSSTASTKTSLEAIRNGEAGLTEKRKNMLARVPCSNTHSDYGKIKPSADDREFLKHIGQKSSIIISYITGAEFEFGSNSFEEI